MRILVTGANGQVGGELQAIALMHLHEVVALGHEDLDITDLDMVRSVVDAAGADVLINAAAFTNVEKAESDYDKALAVNALGAENLAKACLEAQILLIHISTDYVFSKVTGAPHSEDEDACVESAYGRSKLEGERLILESGANAVIVRASWIFGRLGRNFVKTMLRIGSKQSAVNVVCDQRGNPTPARALAEALITIAEIMVRNPETDCRGIYHFCGAQDLTWDEFARVIFNHAVNLGLINHDVKVNSIASFEYPSKVKRPFDSRLDCLKIRRVFGIKQPQYENYLDETLLAEAAAMDEERAKAALEER